MRLEYGKIETILSILTAINFQVDREFHGFQYFGAAIGILVKLVYKPL